MKEGCAIVILPLIAFMLIPSSACLLSGNAENAVDLLSLCKRLELYANDLVYRAVKHLIDLPEGVVSSYREASRLLKAAENETGAERQELLLSAMGIFKSIVLEMEALLPKAEEYHEGKPWDELIVAADHLRPDIAMKRFKLREKGVVDATRDILAQVIRATDLLLAEAMRAQDAEKAREAYRLLKEASEELDALLTTVTAIEVSIDLLAERADKLRAVAASMALVNVERDLGELDGLLKESIDLLKLEMFEDAQSQVEKAADLASRIIKSAESKAYELIDQRAEAYQAILKSMMMEVRHEIERKEAQGVDVSAALEMLKRAEELFDEATELPLKESVLKFAEARSLAIDALRAIESA